MTIPVTIVANGNEASTAFSINYTTTRVVYTGATLGSNAVGATMLVNTNQIGSGRIGVAVAFPPQATFPVGTNEVVRLNFDSLPLLGARAF